MPLERLTEKLKHLPGKHQQLSHGGKRGAVTSDVPPHVEEALTAVNRLVTTGGTSGTPDKLGSEARAFLKKTVTKKHYTAYRGMGLIAERVNPQDRQTIDNLKVGDTVPDTLLKQGNNLASYSTKKSVANYYSEGQVSIIWKAKIPSENVLVDLSKLKDVLKSEGINQKTFDEDDFDYFATDKEIIVVEPFTSGTIIKKEGNF